MVKWLARKVNRRPHEHFLQIPCRASNRGVGFSEEGHHGCAAKNNAGRARHGRWSAIVARSTSMTLTPCQASVGLHQTAATGLPQPRAQQIGLPPAGDAQPHAIPERITASRISESAACATPKRLNRLFASDGRRQVRHFRPVADQLDGPRRFSGARHVGGRFSGGPAFSLRARTLRKRGRGQGKLFGCHSPLGSRIIAQASWTAARNFLASLS